jgi:hypothetical protein
MPDRPTTLFGWRHLVGGLSASGERFALQIDQFLIQVVAFGLQGRKLCLGRGKLRTQLNQLSQHICEYDAQVIALGLGGRQLRLDSC